MKRSAKIALLCLAFALAAFGLGAQQITRIGVVDLGKIIMSYSKDSAALRDFELKKSQIQSEIDRGAGEIKLLQSQRVEAEKAGDRTALLRIEGELGRKTEYLREYIKVKQEELDRDAANLGSSNQFVQSVYRQIQLVAESEGYSLVLNLKSADSVTSAVMWYSPMIDITDKVIQALIGKAQ